jgi:hypothetical protein
LKSGFVLVGNVPTQDGSSNTLQPGSLLILDSNGHQVLNLTDSTFLDSPWDLTINDLGDRAHVFVSNAVTGKITRIDLSIPSGGVPSVQNMTVIGDGFAHHTDPAALLVGPTGLAYDPQHDILYVASTGDNAIFAIRQAAGRRNSAGMGTLIYQDNTHLHGPLGLVLAPNGNLITTNGDAVNPDPNQPSEIVEFTVQGQFVGQMSVDTGAGGAFGLAVGVFSKELRFAAVDDVTNSLDVWAFGT